MLCTSNVVDDVMFVHNAAYREHYFRRRLISE